MNCEKKIELKKLLCWNKLVLKKPVFKKFFVEKSFGNFFNRPKLLILTIFYILYCLYCLLGALSAKSTAFPWHQTLLLGECVGCWNSHHGSQNNNIAFFENNCVFQHVLAVISKCLTLQT